MTHETKPLNNKLKQDFAISNHNCNNPLQYTKNSSSLFFKPFIQPQLSGNNSNIKLMANSVTAFVPNGDTFDDKPVKQDDSKIEEVAPTEIKVSSTSSCNPTGVTNDEFLKVNGNKDDAFGITRLNSNDVIFPEVILNKGKLQKTDASMQVSSFYLKAQTFKDKGVVIMQEDGGTENNYCPKGRYERHWEITPSGADKIKEGEQEHCSDFNFAFNLSLAVFRDAVNAAVGKTFTSESKAKSFLEKQTKVHPDKWQSVFWCLASKTLERDSMNWHLPKFINPRINKTCNKAIVRIGSMNLPEIGKHPSTEIVKDCEVKKDK